MIQGSRSDVLNLLSDTVLAHFLIARGIQVPSGASHEQLAALASDNADRPIVPVASTPPSVFDVLTLAHLSYFLRKKHDEAVNANASWSIASPPKLARTKVDALRKHAAEEIYAKRIAGDAAALDQFGKDIADTWKFEVKLSSDVPDLFFSPVLRDDDIDVLYKDLGLDRDRTADTPAELDELTRVLRLLQSGRW